jgi:hypothetical protein
MKKWVNKVFREIYRYRLKRIQEYMQHPERIQQEVLANLLETAKHTEWGKKYHFSRIKTAQEFANAVPIQNYDTLYPYIEKMMHGAEDVLWSGQIKWFSKSSGTTSGRSKYIPVSSENLKECHIKGTWDTMTFFYDERDDARQFECKSLLMGGSLSAFPGNPNTIIGDVSAIMIEHMPMVGRPFFTPDFATALLPNFEEKIEKIAQITAKEKEMVMIGGVPTWTLVLFRRILEITGAEHMLEVWPELQGYIHGGVSFGPHRKQFEKMLPGKQVSYQEIYNASEGFFAVQDRFDADDMLLLLDNGVYFEFLPQSEWEKEAPIAVPLEAVELGKIYAIVISTNAGLWRYTPGDTIEFTTKYPFRIKIKGRMTQFVNAFGEEVILANTDSAIAQTCTETNAMVSEYMVAPIYFKGGDKGGHEWLIEFEKQPPNLHQFNELLDKNLQKINSDYEAKRYKSMALEQLRMHPVPAGTFHEWLRSKGKFGGQNKVPRLSNDRKYIEEVLGFLEESI